jgi:transglutaminase-like putative cysteine protease
MNLFRQSRYSSNVATLPLIGMVLALVAAIIPLAEKIAGWVLLGFLGACIARVLLNRPGARLPSVPVKLLLFAGSVGGVALSYGSPVGIEPGFSILVALVGLKLIEANGPRDFHVLAMLGFFLALCDLFFSQDLIRWLYIGAIVLLVLATLVRFHRGAASRYSSSAWFAVKLIVQSIPIAALLFLFFPRVYGGFRFQFSQSLMNIGGMSDRLSPGSVSSMALNNAVVFRADFPDGNIPPISAMYWRGGVLWRGDGLTWVPVLFFLRNEYHAGPMSGAPIRQRISLQPHGGRWLFALDRPVELRGANYLPGGVLQSKRTILSRFRYEVLSRPNDRETTLPRDQREAALQLPAYIDPRVKALVESWKAGNARPEQIIDAATLYFHREHFVYTLQPGGYNDRDGLGEFLFERRQGFCEHYAAAFATLMRVAGIPSRIVIGYHGGEFNSLGQYVIVRQSDAHAWCEVWLKDSGWERVDPTDVIAPDRISSSLASYLESHAPQNDAGAADRSLAATGWREIRHDFQLAWDSVNYQWDLHILNFDEEAQTNFLMSLGLGSLSWTDILFWVLIVTALFVAMLSYFLRRTREPVDKVAKGYAGFCHALARAGLPREPWEGAQHFAARAAERFPEQAPVIERISSLYIALRYGRGAADARPFLAAVRHLPRFAATSGT